MDAAHESYQRLMDEQEHYSAMPHRQRDAAQQEIDKERRAMAQTMRIRAATRRKAPA